MEDVDVTRESERRDNPRIRVTRPVVLHHTKYGTEAGLIRDISLDGVFVESDWKNLPTFTAVELTVTLRSGEQRIIKEYRLPAVVSRRTENGFGLKFDHLDMEAYSALLELLYSN